MISVIIPVYNAAEYLKDCVESVYAQEETDYELLLVDDGSTDGSGQLCDELAKKAPVRACVFHTANRGAAAARNYGIRMAEGDYIAFIDSDDTVSPCYLSYLKQNAIACGADISVCGYRKIFRKEENGLPAEQAAPGAAEEPIVYKGTEGLEKLLYQKHFMSVPWGMLTKRFLWERVSFPEGTKAEDMGTIYRLFAESKVTVYGPQACYFYIQRAGNTMFSTSVVRNQDYFLHSREMVRFIKENYPVLMPAARSRHFSACFQILSETPEKTGDTKLLGKIYADVRRMRLYVVKDKKARFQNRVAAGLSYISVGFLHFVLRIYYRMQQKKL